MSKPRILVAEEDLDYSAPLIERFMQEFKSQIQMEIITDPAYFEDLFLHPQKADALICSQSLYTEDLLRHSIGNIFVLCEGMLPEEKPGNVEYIYKYDSVQSIFLKIAGKCRTTLGADVIRRREPQIVVVTSAGKSSGATTVALGMSQALCDCYKQVLYIQASHLQDFIWKMSDQSAIPSQIVSTLLAKPQSALSLLAPSIRKEGFSYLAPFKSALFSRQIPFSFFAHVAALAKASRKYEYIIVDTDETFDEDKVCLFDLADKVVMVTDQSLTSVKTACLLASNISGIRSSKYIFLCNRFNPAASNALSDENIPVPFTITEYIDHNEEIDTMSPARLGREPGIIRVVTLLL